MRGNVSPSDVFDIVSQMEPTPEPPKPLTWDEPEKRKFEYGVSQGILFPTREDGAYGHGVPWNGLVNITDSPDGAEQNKMYADGMIYAGMQSAENYHADIEAYTYPDEFADCDGTRQPTQGMSLGQQSRRRFGLSWRSEIGNANTESAGYKIHVAYGLTAQPSEKPHDTVNESPEAETFSWTADSQPVQVLGHKPTSKLEFDSTKLSHARMEVLEDLLHGGMDTTMPLPTDILNMLAFAYDGISRQQTIGEIDYVKDGVLYRGASAPTILVLDESELDILAPICEPGSFAFLPDMSHMWQLDAYEHWVRMI